MFLKFPFLTVNRDAAALLGSGAGTAPAQNALDDRWPAAPTKGAATSPAHDCVFDMAWGKLRSVIVTSISPRREIRAISETSFGAGVQELHRGEGLRVGSSG